MNPRIKVGIIGCGAISNAYFNGCKTFPILEIVRCADIDVARAEAKAAEHGIPRHGTVEQLLADPEVDIVVNLTIPRAHASVNLAAIGAGKHVFCEKPFAISREEGRPVLEAAEEKGVLVGSAPDTFFGASHQTCRKLIDDGAIGRPVAATAFMAGHGHESWHPSPAFYYDIGGGPMFDMGPYYFTAMVNLMGPMRRVAGSTKITFPERLIGSEPLKGTRIEVKTPTHLAGTVDFQNGAIATMMMSFDVWHHHLPCLEIHGTEGSLAVPDPNGTGGDVFLRRAEHREWRNMPITHTQVAGRGAAVADMAYAIVEGRPHRANGEMANHVVDAMQAFDESSRDGRHIELSTRCSRPGALSPGLTVGTIS
jgi:predicted dehydrogenase